MFISINPYTGEVLAERPYDSDLHLKQKLDNAARAFLHLKAMGLAKVQKALVDIALELEANLEAHASTICLEMGKIISEAKAEVNKCVGLCRYYADHAASWLYDYASFLGKDSFQIKIEAKGTVLGIMPWNYPYWQVFRYVIPNIFLGNTCLLKHAPNVGLCAQNIETLFERHFGAPVLQSCWADISQIELLVAHPTVIGTTLTGSTRAGASLAQISGKYLKKCVLELGGNDPFLVDTQVDLPWVVKKALEGRLHNNGQTCISPKRFIILKARYQEFVELLKEALNDVNHGSPFDIDSQLSCLARKDLATILQDQISEAIGTGAKASNNWTLDGNKAPALVLEVNSPDNKAFQDELFGPIFSCIPAQSLEEMILFANSSKYGLGASIWSQDQKTIEKLAQELETGMVYINENTKSEFDIPFGGTKASGFGKELSILGMTEFALFKTIKKNPLI